VVAEENDLKSPVNRKYVYLHNFALTLYQLFYQRKYWPVTHKISTLFPPPPRRHVIPQYSGWGVES
jgi:hypothetical protein